MRTRSRENATCWPTATSPVPPKAASCASTSRARTPAGSSIMASAAHQNASSGKFSGTDSGAPGSWRSETTGHRWVLLLVEAELEPEAGAVAVPERVARPVVDGAHRRRRTGWQRTPAPRAGPARRRPGLPPECGGRWTSGVVGHVRAWKDKVDVRVLMSAAPRFSDPPVALTSE